MSSDGYLQAVATIGFLHTADVHTATFTALATEIAPTALTTHLVDPELLADAQARDGVDAELRSRIAAQLREAASGADVVVCTCSTISGTAEELGADMNVPVIRVDRPMAERAVATGPRTAVVAALASTIAPTTALLRQVAKDDGTTIHVDEHLCADAWARFDAGDQDGYLDAVAATIDAITGPVDVIVLAQASMAGAAHRATTAVPVLSSPRLAVERAAEAISR